MNKEYLKGFLDCFLDYYFKEFYGGDRQELLDLVHFEILDGKIEATVIVEYDITPSTYHHPEDYFEVTEKEILVISSKENLYDEMFTFIEHLNEIRVKL